MKFLAFLAIAIYLICSLLYLDRPGLYYDETLFVNVALGNEDGSFIDLEAHIGRYRIPLTVMPYIGALKSYLYFPIFKVFGTSPATVRLPPILLGLLTFGLTYLVVRNTLGTKVALLTIVLLATDPAFIFTNKLDWGPNSLMMFLKMVSLYFLFRWMHEGRSFYLYIAALIIGLGIFDKAVFLWYVAAVSITFLLLFWSYVKTVLNWKRVILCIVCIVPFILPSIIANVRSSWYIFNQRKVFNIEIIKTFDHRRVLFDDTINGTAMYEWINNQHFASPTFSWNSENPSTSTIWKIEEFLRRSPLKRTLMAHAALLTVILIPLLSSFGWLSNRRYVLFYFLLMILITCFIYITDMGTGPHHVLTIYPFPHILIASLLTAKETTSVRNGEKKIWCLSKNLVMAFCLISILLSNLLVNSRYLTSLSFTGGNGAWSDSIYRLEEYAENRKDKTFLLMDWGLGNPLLVLGRNRIKKEEVAFNFADVSTEDEKLQLFEPLLERQDGLFVFYVPKYSSQPSLDYFKKAVIRYGREWNLIKSFNQRDGNPVYLIYEIVQPQPEQSPENTFCLQLEAESFSSKSGGGIFFVDFTSNGAMLADFWGQNFSDFASYQLSTERDISNAKLFLRYAYEEPLSQTYYLYLDNQLVDVIILQSSGGFGHTPEEWKIADSAIGTVQAGNHLLTIKPSKDANVINLDYLSIGERDACMPSVPTKYMYNKNS